MPNRGVGKGYFRKIIAIAPYPTHEVFRIYVNAYGVHLSVSLQGINLLLGVPTLFNDNQTL